MCLPFTLPFTQEDMDLALKEALKKGTEYMRKNLPLERVELPIEELRDLYPENNEGSGDLQFVLVGSDD